jgi:ribosome-binding protein aMBF1 (putative translation factor)
LTTVLHQRRKALGLNQTELAARVGCKQQTISVWEHGGCIMKRQHRVILEALFDRTTAELERETAPAEADAAKGAHRPPLNGKTCVQCSA